MDLEKLYERAKAAQTKYRAFKEKLKQFKEEHIGAWKEKEIREYKPAVKLKFITKCVIDLLAVLFSSLSVIAVAMLYYARKNVESILPYYENPAANYASEAFSALFNQNLLLLCWLPVFFFAFRYQVRRHILRQEKAASGVFVALFFSGYTVFPLCMAKSSSHEILLPCSILFYLPGLFLLFTSAIRFIYQAIDWKTEKRYTLQRNDSVGTAGIFCITLCIILLLWLPVVLICYPGSLDFDTLQQLKEYFGLRKKQASNPIFLTYLYGFIYDFGKSTANETKGAALLLLFQTLLCSFSVSWAITKIYQYTKSWIFYIISILLYTVVPTWPCAVQFLIKDTFHSAVYLLFCTQFFECLRKDQLNRSDYISLFAWAAASVLSRNAAFYIIIILLILLILMRWKRGWKKVFICLAALILLNSGINRMLPLFNISKPREVENYSMPLQIMGAYVQKYKDEFTEEDIEIFNRTLNFDAVVENYSPLISDPIKITYHGNAEDHAAFWELFKKCMLKHPSIIPKALVMNSYQHFNPFSNGGAVRMHIYISKDETFHHLEYKYAKYKLPTNLLKYWEKWRDYPLLYLFLGAGSFGWVSVLMSGYAVRKRSWLAFSGLTAVLIPFYGLIFSHVNGLLRYGYPVIAVCPLAVAYVIMIVSASGKTKIDPINKKMSKVIVSPLIMMEIEDQKLREKNRK